ncbi:HAD-like domain-containing protein [Lipomyces arxii]|uniref:HAD-like domain-containing protein n=1 Tax=Lipomyces arxii TaxID=56418 RepID=UPI0034CDDBF0
MAYKYILLDIEGTCCEISFVKDVLVPYFLEKLPAVLHRHFSQYPPPDLQVFIDEFAPVNRKSYDSLYSHICELTAADKKLPELKALQGYVWRQGYEDGELRVPLFPDVYDAFDRWSTSGSKKVSIYSSGSVDAQILLFSHTEKGSLTNNVEAYFDTVNAGPKTDAESYLRIADVLAPGIDRKEILFLSDNVKEVEAALQAGLESYVVERKGNAPLSGEDRAKYTIIHDFNAL